MRRDDYIKESEAQSIKKNIELIVDLYRKYKSQFKRQSELVKFIADKVELPEMSVVQALEMNAESKEKKMSNFEKYVEMAKKYNNESEDEILEKMLHNLNKDELIDMVLMHIPKKQLRSDFSGKVEYELGDMDDDEIVDYLLQALSDDVAKKLIKE